MLSDCLDRRNLIFFKKIYKGSSGAVSAIPELFLSDRYLRLLGFLSLFVFEGGGKFKSLSTQRIVLKYTYA